MKEEVEWVNSPIEWKRWKYDDKILFKVQNIFILSITPDSLKVCPCQVHAKFCLEADSIHSPFLITFSCVIKFMTDWW